MYVRMRDKLVDVSSLRPKFQVISRGSWTPHLARYLTDAETTRTTAVIYICFVSLGRQGGNDLISQYASFFSSVNYIFNVMEIHDTVVCAFRPVGIVYTGKRRYRVKFLGTSSGRWIVSSRFVSFNLQV